MSFGLLFRFFSSFLIYCIHSFFFLALIFAFLEHILVSLLLSTLLNLSFWPFIFAFLALFLIYCVNCLSGSHFRFFGPIFGEFIAIYTSKTYLFPLFQAFILFRCLCKLSTLLKHEFWLFIFTFLGLFLSTVSTAFFLALIFAFFGPYLLNIISTLLKHSFWPFIFAFIGLFSYLPAYVNFYTVKT